MKKFGLLLLGVGMSCLTMAQSNLSIEYDDAGNRTLRKVIVLNSSSQDDGSARQTDSTQTISYSDDMVSIYPNPTRYYVNLEFSEMDIDETISFQLHDEQGRFVMEKTVNQHITKVDLSKEPNGVYLLSIQRRGKLSQWQIVKIG